MALLSTSADCCTDGALVVITDWIKHSKERGRSWFETATVLKIRLRNQASTRLDGLKLLPSLALFWCYGPVSCAVNQPEPALGTEHRSPSPQPGAAAGGVLRSSGCCVAPVLWHCRRRANHPSEHPHQGHHVIQEMVTTRLARFSHRPVCQVGQGLPQRKKIEASEDFG